METYISISNGLTAFAFFAFIILLFLVKREGKDERAQYMGYKLLGLLYTFLFGGLSILIFVTGWETVSYTMLRVSLSMLLSLHIFLGLGYWVYLTRKV
ncbi:hypothetical protein LC040_02990 [Bacillus tianshenii]|nr:hypothetical protein LC040_02990 [Bacillus tianshenii]